MSSNLALVPRAHRKVAAAYLVVTGMFSSVAMFLRALITSRGGTVAFLGFLALWSSRSSSVEL